MTSQGWSSTGADGKVAEGKAWARAIPVGGQTAAKGPIGPVGLRRLVIVGLVTVRLALDPIVAADEPEPIMLPTNNPVAALEWSALDVALQVCARTTAVGEEVVIAIEQLAIAVDGVEQTEGGEM